MDTLLGPLAGPPCLQIQEEGRVEHVALIVLPPLEAHFVSVSPVSLCRPVVNATSRNNKGVEMGRPTMQDEYHRGSFK